MTSLVKSISVYLIEITVQGDQVNMTVCLWYFVKKLHVQFTLLYIVLQKSLFTRCQKKAAMFNWSPCRGWDCPPPPPSLGTEEQLSQLTINIGLVWKCSDLQAEWCCQANSGKKNHNFDCSRVCTK